MEPNPTTLDTVREILAILEPYRWPLLIVLVVFIFKKKIDALLDRIEEFSGSGYVFRFGKSRVDSRRIMESDHLESKTEPLVPSTKPETVTSDWGKIKNAFWLGHHLTWTMDIILRGGRASDIAYEFLQCGIFIRDLNLLSTSFGQRFVKLNEEAKTILSKELTRADRETLVVELSAILNEFNVVATQKISSQGGSTAG